jgi:Chain length determinant protein
MIPIAPIPRSSKKMTDTPHYPEDDEISLLDLLQTIVDNLRLLVIGPIVAGLLALAGASFCPKTYESTAILKAQPIVTSIMISAAVLDPIASRLSYTPQMPSDDARTKSKEQIKDSINNKGKRLNLTIQANTPQAAQARRKKATQTAQLLARKFDSAGGTGASEVAQGYAQMIEVTKKRLRATFNFLLNNIALR